MIAIRIACLLAGLLALVLTFKAKLIVEKLLRKAPSEGMVLRVKYIALAIAIVAFLTVMIFGK